MIKVRISPDHIYSADSGQNVAGCSIVVYDEKYLNEQMDLRNINDLVILRDALSVFIDNNLTQVPGSKRGKRLEKVTNGTSGYHCRSVSQEGGRP